MRDTYPAVAVAEEAEPPPPLAPVLRRRPELLLREEDEEEEDDEEEEEVSPAIRGRGWAQIASMQISAPASPGAYR